MIYFQDYLTKIKSTAFIWIYFP